MDVRVGLWRKLSQSCMFGQKADQRIDTFELWCWRRLLRVLWTARRSNQSILKQTSPGCSLEGLMLKLKLQYSGHLMWRTDSLEKTLMLERLSARQEGSDRGWDGWMASLTQWTWVWARSGRWWWTGRPGVLHSLGLQKIRHDWASNTYLLTYFLKNHKGFPRWLIGKESTCNAGNKRYGCHFWAKKMSLRRKWQSTSVFLPGKSHGPKSLVGHNPPGGRQKSWIWLSS